MRSTRLIDEFFIKTDKWAHTGFQKGGGTLNLSLDRFKRLLFERQLNTLRDSTEDASGYLQNHDR